MLSPKRGIDKMVLGGILNSEWMPLFREMDGRTIMGEGLNRNQVMVYEARRIPVPDMTKFTKSQSNRIKMKFKKMLNCESSSDLLKIKNELTRIVLAAMGMEKLIDKLNDAWSKYEFTVAEKIKRLCFMTNLRRRYY